MVLLDVLTLEQLEELPYDYLCIDLQISMSHEIMTCYKFYIICMMIEQLVTEVK